MEFTPLGIEGVWLANSPVHGDERGSFREWFRLSEIEKINGLRFDVKQANISINKLGVLRGIHFSLSSGGQSKFVTCVTGKIIDVVVDIRPDSPTFGKFEIIELVGGDGNSIYVGNGLGHSFLAIQEQTIVSYLLDSPYSIRSEYGINPFDSDLGIDWKTFLPKDAVLTLSRKDQTAPSLKNLLESNSLPTKENP